MTEADLYAPLKHYLERQGYEVKGEVQTCDVVAVHPDQPEPLVVELKLTFSLTVLLQAVDRLVLTDTVYIGVPAGLPVLRRQSKQVLKLLRLAGFGLILIDPDFPGGGRVDIALHPVEFRPKRNKRKLQRLLSEFHARDGDPNAGGRAMRRGGLVTAYRQRALKLAVHLAASGPQKASDIAKTVGDPKARDILYANVYHWFESHGKGVYSLAPRGHTELPNWLDS
jgi:hypothetical protein